MHDVGDIIYLVDGAVELLAIGEDDIKRRLLRAYTQKIAYLSPDSLPTPMSALLQSIHQRLTAQPTYNGQSTTESALYRMHRKTASRIASDILELQRGVHRLQGAA